MPGSGWLFLTTVLITLSIRLQTKAIPGRRNQLCWPYDCCFEMYCFEKLSKTWHRDTVQAESRNDMCWRKRALSPGRSTAARICQAQCQKGKQAGQRGILQTCMDSSIRQNVAQCRQLKKSRGSRKESSKRIKGKNDQHPQKVENSLFSQPDLINFKICGALSTSLDILLH